MQGKPAQILMRVIACALSATICGCASQNSSSQAAKKEALKEISFSTRPFDYTPLKVPNSCFVESVHFYDEYLANKRGGAEGWVRVLQWGNDDGRYLSIGDGHAVAVCRSGDVLWMYDINHGFVPLLVPVERRNDVTDVGPEIFGKYPQFKPMYVSYREDLMPSRPGNIPAYLSGNMNADVRNATKVASELGQRRVVRVLGFNYPDSRTGQVRTGAAALFAFGQRLCIYFPSKGTHLSRLYAGSLDDLVAAAKIIRAVYPGAGDVTWQGGDTWKQPRPSSLAGAKERPLTAEPQPARYIDVDVTLW